jgi:hypothetical protein
MRKAVLVGFIFSLANASAFAADGAKYTGNDLQQLCSLPNDNGCVAFAFGFESGITAAQEGWRICVPAEVTGQQLEPVIEKYLREHPEQLHKNARLLSAEALTTVFPCRRSN